jgi:hypothetical protein
MVSAEHSGQLRRQGGVRAIGNGPHGAEHNTMSAANLRGGCCFHIDRHRLTALTKFAFLPWIADKMIAGQEPAATHAKAFRPNAVVQMQALTMQISDFGPENDVADSEGVIERTGEPGQYDQRRPIRRGAAKHLLEGGLYSAGAESRFENEYPAILVCVEPSRTNWIWPGVAAAKGTAKCLRLTP